MGEIGLPRAELQLGTENRVPGNQSKFPQFNLSKRDKFSCKGLRRQTLEGHYKRDCEDGFNLNKRKETVYL